MDNTIGDRFLHILTLISIGIMAYVFACIGHEAIGHGLVSLILGNEITLMTSVYFRSATHSFITDAFGPLLNLLCGLVIAVVLKEVSFSNLYIRLLFILTMAFNFFWFSWMCIYSAVTNTGDFAFYISGEATLYFWRGFLLIAGVFSYYSTFKLTSKRIEFQSSATINVRQLFSIPYLSAGIAALIAVAFYRPFDLDNFREAFVFPMFLPVLFLARQEKNNYHTNTGGSYGHQRKIIMFGLSFFILFCLTMGRGIKL